MPSSRPAAPLTLSDLLHHHELKLEQLTGPADLGERRLSGVHSIEIEQPTRWLAPDWVMLTTGVRLRDRPDEQRALVRELADGGVTALGFARAVVFDEVPQPLLDEARALDFPVFAVPLETPFREIIAFVQRSLLSSDMRALQRLASIQRYLVDAMHEPDPRAAVVERLATVLEASVAVLGPQGRLEQGVGELPDAVADALPDPAAGLSEIDVGDAWHVLATPVAPALGEHSRWLVAASRGSGLQTRLTRPALQATAPLLDAIGRLEDAIAAQDRAVRSALLEQLMDLGDGDGTALAARAATFDVHLDRPHQVVCLAHADGSPESGALAHALTQRLSLRQVPYLACSSGDDAAVVLLPRVEGPVEDALRSLVDRDEQVVCGLGRVFEGPGAVRESYADARVACELAASRGTRWQPYETLDLPTLLVGQVPAERLTPVVGGVLALLDAHRPMREALEAWFAHDLDVTAAAEALHLHPNSLRYRLQRFADLLGAPLRAPRTIATLHLALEAERRNAVLPQR